MSEGGTTSFRELPIGGLLNDQFVDCYPGDEYTTDDDWFRVPLAANTTYVISAIAETGSILVDMKYASGNSIFHTLIDAVDSRTSQEHVYFTPRVSAYYFAKVFDPADESSSRYTISANVVADFARTINTFGVLSRDYFKISDIFVPLDEDWFKFEFYPDRRHVFVLRGVDTGNGTLPDPILRIYDSQGNLVTTNDNYSTDNRNARIAFQPRDGGTFFISAAGAATDTGTYYLATATIDDFATGPTTKGIINPVDDQMIVKKGDLEHSNDIDWFKVPLQKGKWYGFNIASAGTSHDFTNLFLRDPANEIVAGNFSNNYRQFHFQAQATGIHHLIARSGAPGAYFVSVTSEATPILSAKRPRFTILDTQQINLGEIIQESEFPADRYEVFSNAELQFGTEFFAANTLHSFTPEQLASVEVSNSAAVGDHTISFRARSNDPLTGNVATGWASTTLSIVDDPTMELRSIWQWSYLNTLSQDDNITIGFPTELPDYYSTGEIDGFMAVSDTLRYTLVRTIEHLEDIVPNVSFVGNQDADINIFMSTLPGVPWKSNWPGRDSGGDIMLNPDLYLNFDSYNTNDYLEFILLRGLGKALGMKPFASEYDLDESIMGNNVGSTGEAFPSSFGVQDILTLQQSYGAFTTDRLIGGPKLPDSTEPSFKTVYHSGKIRSINNSLGSIRDTLIDIRPGHISYFTDGAWPTQMLRLAYGTNVEFAVGGDGNDTLIGNAFNNTLRGRNNHDFLSGGLGNDKLEGGYGNDTYEFKTGWGTDRIKELLNLEDPNDGGRDTLRLYANFSPGRLEHDLSFRRAGNHLQIDLDLNDQYNRGNGTVIIENMTHVNQRVERLELFVGNKLQGTYSLMSAWEHATSYKQRFGPTGASDQFGQLVAPIG